MKSANLFSKTVDPQLMEHFDAYVLVGYKADNHRKVVEANFGRDESCRDGLRIMEVAAERWQDGSMFPGKPSKRFGDGDDENGNNGKEAKQ